MDYLSVHFIFYLLRWVVSAFVMMIPLYFINEYKLTNRFGNFKEYIDLILVQIVGAFIFYYIDYFIFVKFR